MSTAAPPAHRLSTAKRQTQLRAWLLAGHTPEEVIRRAAEELAVRPKRVERDLAHIQATWKNQLPGESHLDYLWFSRLQRDRLLSRVLRRLENCESPKEELRLVGTAHRLMKERDAIMAKIDALSSATADPHTLGDPFGSLPCTRGRVGVGAEPAETTSASALKNMDPAAAEPIYDDDDEGPTLQEMLDDLPPDLRQQICPGPLLPIPEPPGSTRKKAKSPSASAAKNKPKDVSGPSQEQAQPKD